MMKLSLLGSGLLLTALLLNGCGPSAAPDKAGESVFRYGTTAYGVAMENAGMDPHESYKLVNTALRRRRNAVPL